jgi:hypothetical protein
MHPQQHYDRLTHADKLRVDRAVKHGVPFYYAVSIMMHVRSVKHLTFPLGLALFEQETGFRHVYGHDPTIFIGGHDSRSGHTYRTVGKTNYLAYKRQRGPTGRGGMQGVGPGQLTWYATQDMADKLGGSWNRHVNMGVALETLALNIKIHGYVVGIQRYNGTGAAAIRYSASVRSKARRWNSVVNP